MKKFAGTSKHRSTYKLRKRSGYFKSWGWNLFPSTYVLKLRVRLLKMIKPVYVHLYLARKALNPDI